MNITKIALNRVKNHDLTVEQQKKRLDFISNKNSLEAKVIVEVIRILEDIEYTCNDKDRYMEMLKIKEIRQKLIDEGHDPFWYGY